VREQRLNAVRVIDLQTHLGGFEPARVQLYVENARASGDVITEPLGIVFDVPWDLHLKTYGPARGYLRRGDNRALTLLEVMGTDVTLREARPYWYEQTSAGIHDFHRALAFYGPTVLKTHHLRYREWVSTNGRRPAVVADGPMAGLVEPRTTQYLAAQAWQEAWADLPYGSIVGF
jgi:hypothetical protein